jgi:hypothetical protein
MADSVEPYNTSKDALKTTFLNAVKATESISVAELIAETYRIQMVLHDLVFVLFDSSILLEIEDYQVVLDVVMYLIGYDFSSKNTEIVLGFFEQGKLDLYAIDMNNTSKCKCCTTAILKMAQLYKSQNKEK